MVGARARTNLEQSVLHLGFRKLETLPKKNSSKERPCVSTPVAASQKPASPVMANQQEGAEREYSSAELMEAISEGNKMITSKIEDLNSTKNFATENSTHRKETRRLRRRPEQN